MVSLLEIWFSQEQGAKKRFWILFFLLFFFSFSSFAGAQEQVVEGSNALAFRILGALEEEDFVFSPYSVFSTLSMVYGGASGNTKKQMAEVLSIPMEIEGLPRRLSSLTATRKEQSAESSLSFAHSLWVQKDMELASSYLEYLFPYPALLQKEVNFQEEESRHRARQEVNQWIGEKTGGHILDLIREEDLSVFTRLLLMNALYFQGLWEEPFEETNTHWDVFHSASQGQVQVPMMNKEGRFAYAETKDYQVLELPYSGDSLVMTLFLPKNSEEEFTLDTYKELLPLLSLSSVEVFLPRFTQNTRLSLSQILMALGMEDAFSPDKADFSLLSPQNELYLSRVLHASTLQVQEKGTEAAASTAAIFELRSIFVPGTFVFLADRPFFFVIRDTVTELILFMGRCADPRL